MKPRTVMLVVLALVGLLASAAAEREASPKGDTTKALKPYAGQIVLSADAPPTDAGALPAYLKANVEKSGRYEFMKWDLNFVAVLAKPADKVTLLVAAPPAADKKTAAMAPLISIELTPTHGVVIGHFKPTKAAGFAIDKIYAVTLVSGTTIVGKAELVFRE